MKIKYLLLVVILFVFVFYNNVVCAEFKDGAVIPTAGINVGVNVGTNAPALDLYDWEGDKAHITFGGTPTVIISLYSLNNEIDKIKQLVKLYPDKNELKFIFIAQNEVEYTRVTLLKNNLDIPVYYQQKRDFSIKYNQTIPSMVIINEQGVVCYNNTFYVDINSVDSFLKDIIAGGNKKMSPILYSEPKVVNIKVPKLYNDWR